MDMTMKFIGDNFGGKCYRLGTRTNNAGQPMLTLRREAFR